MGNTTWFDKEARSWYETESKNRSYPKVFLPDFSRAVAKFFERCAAMKIDCITTENVLLGSKAFKEVLTRANPIYLNMGSSQLFDCVQCEEGFDWKHSKRMQTYEPDIMWWVGKVLAYFQWAYRIDFSDWLEYESIEEIYNIYYPLHEASYENAAAKLMNRYYTKKLNSCTEKERNKYRKEISTLIDVYPELYAELA